MAAGKCALSRSASASGGLFCKIYSVSPAAASRVRAWPTQSVEIGGRSLRRPWDMLVPYVIYAGAVPMSDSKSIAKGSFLLGLIMFATGCVVAPREGYYDHDHHRYYHQSAWHDCGERDEHCR
jgi:hypothetical protein